MSETNAPSVSFRDGESDGGLDPREIRRCYLITYSKVDKSKFPTKESFAEAVVESFAVGKSKAKLVHWVCVREEHAEGGFHYHMAVKFSEGKRWKKAKKHLQTKYGISINFTESEKYYNYYSAYKYLIIEDPEPLHSAGHPDLTSASSPKTSKSTKSLMSKKRKRSAESSGRVEQPAVLKPVKNRRLSNFEVAEAVIAKNIRDDRELYALANEQKLEGKTDLASFVLGKSQKAINELISSAWKMNDAAANLARSKTSRMERLEQALQGICVEGCQGQWLVCAKEVLKNNGVSLFFFAAAVRELLEKGRGKYRNLMLVGPANCGKTFILDPLNLIFDTFTNPANASYAWLGAETKEVIFLNDFRYSNEIMAWKDMLLLLEGQTLHLAAPKTSYAQDILFNRDTPIFATGKEPIKYIGKYNTTDATENEMMAVRWRTFEFTHQIEVHNQKSIPSCPRCFAELALSGNDA